MGSTVGLAVVGSIVGKFEGIAVGSAVEGCAVGFLVNFTVLQNGGSRVGIDDGEALDESMGTSVGRTVGVGGAVGFFVSLTLFQKGGSRVGVDEGETVGVSVKASLPSRGVGWSVDDGASCSSSIINVVGAVVGSIVGSIVVGLAVGFPERRTRVQKGSVGDFVGEGVCRT